MALTTPFLQVFAREAKGADQFVLGEMATAGIALYLLFGIPMGRLADRIGRKKVIYLTTPLWYASNFLLVFAENLKTLVVAGALQSFYSISSVAASSMTLELVPVGQMGRWSGLLGLIGGLVTVPAPYNRWTIESSVSKCSECFRNIFVFFFHHRGYSIL